MSRISKVILLLLLVSSCLREENITYKYLPGLKNIAAKIIHEKKIEIDPSYKYPYNVYIELLIDTVHRAQIISHLLLKTQSEIDTTELKKNTNIDEFQNFFEMESINLNRAPGIKIVEKKIKWWPQEGFVKPIYSMSYLDYQSIRKVVQYNQSKNGRIAMSIHGKKVYILIECWG